MVESTWDHKQDLRADPLLCQKARTKTVVGNNIWSLELQKRKHNCVDFRNRQSLPRNCWRCLWCRPSSQSCRDDHMKQHQYKYFVCSNNTKWHWDFTNCSSSWFSPNVFEYFLSWSCILIDFCWVVSFYFGFCIKYLVFIEQWFWFYMDCW